MELHRDLTDLEFEKQFLNCTLDPQLFTHEAHLRLAWINVKRLGQEKAAENMLIMIRKFVSHVGANEKFNVTVTIAAVKTVGHFLRKSSSTSFIDFIFDFPRLKYNFKDLLAQHYQSDIYNNEKAKNSYLEPELLPFT